MVNMALFYLVVTHMSSENNYQQLSSRASWGELSPVN